MSHLPSDTTDAGTNRELYRRPEVRNYLVVALAALVIVFAVLFGRGSDLGGFLVVLVALSGVFLRWPAAPPFGVVLVTYFVLFPTGVPELGPASPWQITRRRFAVEDLLLTAAVVVLVAAQYRVLGVFGRAVPAEDKGPTKPADDAVARRPPGAIGADEIQNLLTAAVVVVVGGQLVWLGLTALRVAPGDPFPVAVADPLATRGGRGSLSPAASRFVLLVGGVFLVAAVARLVFWYGRLRRLTRDEAAMLLQDTAWDEARRELVRAAAWRARVLDRGVTRDGVPGKPDPRSSPFHPEFRGNE